ncbi:MAG TPA: hypothetical protein VG944_12110 [Fimbriimonas sp.]|nr:hypothetical protein [Fimbriimonas sp.]
MFEGPLQIGFDLTCMFVGIMLLVGLFTLFVKAENIERNFLVGGLTLSTALLAIPLLDNAYRHDFPNGYGSLFAVWLLAGLGFGIGRWFDHLLGARSRMEERDDSTFGAHLAD